MKYSAFAFWIAQIGDAIIICLILWAITIANGITSTDNYTVISLLTVLVYTVIKEFNYSDQSLCGESILVILKTWALSVSIIIISLFLFKVSGTYSRLTLSLWFVSTPFVLWILRWFIRLLQDYIFTKEIYQIRVAVLGDGDVASRLIKKIEESPYLGLKITKIYSSNDFIACINEAIKSQFDRLYIVKKSGELFESRNMLDKLSDSSIELYYVPDLLDIELIHSTWSKVGDIDVMSINDSPIQGFNSLIKRVEDIILSIIILTFIAPILVVTGLVVKITSRGPILFKQSRYGLNGREIKVWKFRSMSVCEDKKIIQTIKNDFRVTKVGKFIRRTSIDEFPQFFNVLAGTMSIVGPRPHAIQHNEEFRKLIPDYMRRHIVKPGITGWAQVNGWRGETDTDVKIIKRTEFDMYYIKNWSLLLDLKIIALSLKEIVNKDVY